MKQLAVLPSLRLNVRPLVLVGLTFLGLVTAQASWNSYYAAREEALGAEMEALRFARQAANHQQAVLGQTFHLLRVLGGISLPETRDPAACSSFLARQLDRFPDYENLAFLRADGTPRCSGRLLPFPSLTAADNPAGDPAALSEQRLVLGFQSDSVAAVLPRQKTDDPGDAAVAAIMPLREFFLGHSNALPHDAAFAIMGNTGRLLAAYPSRSDWSGAYPAFSEALLALDPGIVTRLSATPGREHLYIAQPLSGTVQPLRLVIRLPADAATTLARSATLLVAALALAAFTFWLLGRIAVQRAAAWLGRIERKQFSLTQAWQKLNALLHAPASTRRFGQKPRPPGETTILRAAYSDLKAAYADKEERMQRVILLDDLSRTLQACQSMNELAQAVAHCATGLFPGSSGTLRQRTAPDHVETVLAWGTTSPFAGAIALPLLANNEPLGILNLAGINDSDVWASTSLAQRAAAGMAAVRRQEQLRSRAMRDALTGLYNRRFLEEALTIEQQRALRRGTSIGLLIMDIDHFKRFNDTYGHDAGDILLRGIGTLLRRAVREGDMPCRYGGEEFVVILPGADLAGTRQRAETLRAAIAQWNPQRDGQSLGPVTVSIGVAALPTHGSAWSNALKAADQALYEAKHAGRNRVAVAPLQ